MIALTKLITRLLVPLAVLIRPGEVTGSSLPDEYGALNLGKVDFQVSTLNQDAQDWFNYGLLQLMAFGYDYATPAFKEAQTSDPGFALAYAFEAFAEFNPLWSKDDTTTANAIFSKMDATNTTASAREQLYVDSFRAHFDTSIVDVVDRNRKVTELLQKLTEDYPDDPTSFAYLGLFSLVVHTLVDDEEEKAAFFDQAAQALKASLNLQDDHPGAVHYQLHVYDNIRPKIWKQGLPAARKYPEVAPDTSHGLHMPQHILFRNANFAGSWNADLGALKAGDKTCAIYGRGEDPMCDVWNVYHSVEYLQIEGYQCGLWESAHSYFKRMQANYTAAVDMDLINASYLLNFYLRMRAREFLEPSMMLGELFDKKALNVDCPPPIDPLIAGYNNAHTESGYLLARGLCLLGTSYPSVDDALFDVVTARMAEIAEYYATFDTTDTLNYFDRLVHSGHIAMLLGAYHFVRDSGGSLFEEAMANATNYEEIYTSEYWTSAVWTMLHLSPHEFYGQLLSVQAEDDSKDKDARMLANNLAMQEFLASDKTQGVGLSSSLGKARAASRAGNITGTLEYYTQVSEMMHPTSDTQTLPFWSEVQSILKYPPSNPVPEEAPPSDPNDVLEEVTAKILAEVEAVSDSPEVSNQDVYDITSEVVAAFDDGDDMTKSILGHITDAVAELETIHTGDSGTISDILTEIMHTAYGTEAPTPAPTVKVTEATMIDSIKNTITGTTDSATESASSFISNIFNLRRRN